MPEGDYIRFGMVSAEDTDKLLNHTALRDMQIKAFWQGLSYSNLSRRGKIAVVCEKFSTGQKNVEKIVQGL